VPAHPGSPGQNPEGRKMVVVVVAAEAMAVAAVAAAFCGYKTAISCFNALSVKFMAIF